MNAKDTVFRLLQHALIEIRHEAQSGGDIRNIAALADLFHNVPLALADDDVDHDALLAGIEERAAGNSGLSDWLAGNKG